jgi:hypothetical protein
MYDIEILPSWKHKMSKYLDLEEPNLKYVYDLGDNWMHLIELENVLPAEKGATYPICIGGKRNAPTIAAGLMVTRKCWIPFRSYRRGV